MGSRYHPSVYRVQPEEVATHKAVARLVIDGARALLEREPPPDVFLGRQHYALTPLPEETARCRVADENSGYRAVKGVSLRILPDRPDILMLDI